MGTPHRYEVQLRWSDEDRLGHINNTRYLTFAEDARLRWISDLPGRGSPTDRETPGGGGGILARLECDFRRQGHATPDATVVVTGTVTRIGRSSTDLRQVIARPDTTVLAEVKAVLVAFDYVADASRPWTDEQREWLAAFRPADQ